MAQQLAGLAVEAFDALVFAVALRRDVNDPRRLHVSAALIDERPFVVLLLRGLLDAIEPLGGLAPGGHGIVGLRESAGLGGQQRGRAQQQRRQPSPTEDGLIQLQRPHRVYWPCVVTAVRMTGIEPVTTGCCANC
ncbi:hypothetical protein BMMON2_22510 [Burkholderia mallei]